MKKQVFKKIQAVAVLSTVAYSTLFTSAFAATTINNSALNGGMKISAPATLALGTGTEVKGDVLVEKELTVTGDSINITNALKDVTIKLAPVNPGTSIDFGGAKVKIVVVNNNVTEIKGVDPQSDVVVPSGVTKPVIKDSNGGTVLPSQAAPTTASLVKGSNAGTTKLTGVTDKMEYAVNATADTAYILISGTEVDNITVRDGDKISVRYAATNGFKASEPQTLTVTADHINTNQPPSTPDTVIVSVPELVGVKNTSGDTLTVTSDTVTVTSGDTLIFNVTTGDNVYYNFGDDDPTEQSPKVPVEYDGEARIMVDGVVTKLKVRAEKAGNLGQVKTITLIVQ